LYDIVEKKIIHIINKSKKFNKLQEIIDVLYVNFDKYSWIGIYFLKDNNLILGPWKGSQPTEHKVIPIGKGICGSAAKSGKTEIISNVNKDNRYLACFIETKSEIVVPIKRNREIIGEIDIDSNKKNAFIKEDLEFLESLAANRAFIKLIDDYRHEQGR
jgi:GAF domain-containing protein